MLLYRLNSTPNIAPVSLNRRTSNINFKGQAQNDTLEISNKPLPDYLKDETVISRDEFSTTIVDKKAKQSFLDKLLGRRQEITVYDLPLRLADEMTGKNEQVIRMQPPEDFLQATGLTNEELEDKISDIHGLITLVRPKYDMFEEKTKQSFGVKMGNKTAKVERIAQGMSGSVYKIEVEGAKPLALKSFFDPRRVNMSEGPFPEIALSKKMTENRVSNSARLYAANPYSGWMLSQFIDENFEIPENGPSVTEYMKEKDIVCSDLNSGLSVEAKNGKVLVDFGYMSKAGSVNSFFEKNLQEIALGASVKRYNDEKTYAKEKISLEELEMSSIFANNNARKIVINKFSDSTEFNFFNDMITATRAAVMDKEMPEDLKQRLQKEYEALGFVGDAVELAKSSNQ